MNIDRFKRLLQLTPDNICPFCKVGLLKVRAVCNDNIISILVSCPDCAENFDRKMEVEVNKNA